MGRFINADIYTSTGQGMLGNNMFTYCRNNPVAYSDPTGEISWAIIWRILASGIASGTVSALIAWIMGCSEEEILEEYLWSAGLGAVSSTCVIAGASAIGIGSLKSYCDSREDGMDIDSSVLSGFMSTVGSLPLPSMGSMGADLFYASMWGGYSSSLSITCTYYEQKEASQLHETSRNKTVFYHNARAAASIGVSFGIMSNTFGLKGENQYVRI